MTQFVSIKTPLHYQKNSRLLTGNSRFLFQNLLHQLLYYTDIKESCEG